MLVHNKTTIQRSQLQIDRLFHDNYLGLDFSLLVEKITSQMLNGK
ncbi:MAG: hypothetical protein AAGE96_09850 [Cyanobacteria bacterium P01_G01_bin.19]